MPFTVTSVRVKDLQKALPSTAFYDTSLPDYSPRCLPALGSLPFATQTETRPLPPRTLDYEWSRMKHKLPSIYH